MKKVLLLIIAVLMLLGGAYTWYALRSSPVVRVRVNDSSGRSVEGAVVKPYAIRGSNRAHYGWNTNFSVSPKEVRSNSEGLVAIEYPTYLVEGIRSIELTFTTDHPEYCSERYDIAVPAPLPSTAPLTDRAVWIWRRLKTSGQLQTVTLRPGATVEVSGYFEGNADPVEPLFANVETGTGIFRHAFWHRDGGRLVTSQMPPGHLFLQLVHPGENGITYFSELQSFTAATGKTNRLNLPLRPGIRLTGRLDERVPRPVKNGLVNVRTVQMRQDPTDPLVWADYSEITEDGTFTLSSIPPGRIEIIALCDGFVSRNPPNAPFSLVQPQVFALNASAEVLIEMEPTATAHVRVLDDNGRPLSGAEVSFWPNERWGEWSATVLGTHFYRTIELLRIPTEEAYHTVTRSIRDFKATTDSNGVARVAELKGREDSFYVQHPKYEIPIDPDNRRTARVVLVPGETNFTTVKLQKKGKELLE